VNLLTNSRLRVFRDCQRMHRLRYIEGWRPVKESEALRFGSLYHVGLEAWWTAIKDERDPLEAAWLAIRGRAVNPYEQAKVDELIAGYDRKWRGDAARYKVIGAELTFECPLLNPETMRPSTTWRLAGKIDALVTDRETGAVLVMEHKTSTEGFDDPAGAYWARLAMDSQISAYVIGAESLGYQVQETLYDVALRPGLRPKEATPLEARKFTKDGRLYATQREVAETPDEYRTRIRESIEGEPDRYFARRSIPRMASQMREFMEDAWVMATMMRESERRGFAPRNPDACNRFGQCAFWGVCSTGSSCADFPTDYIQSAEKNPELVEV